VEDLEEHLKAGDIHEQADRPGVIIGRILQDLQEWPCSRRSDRVKVTGNEQEYHEKNGSGKGTNPDACYHDFGALDRGVWNFCQE
jgi:hypothetical protein